METQGIWSSGQDDQCKNKELGHHIQDDQWKNAHVEHFKNRANIFKVVAGQFRI